MHRQLLLDLLTDCAWVPIARLGDYTDGESMLRMARKWPSFAAVYCG